MAPERDTDLPPVQPTRRMAVVRGLRPRLWTQRVLPHSSFSAETSGKEPEGSAKKFEPTPEAPLTYDDHAHLHGGPGSQPNVDLED
jgi:hypothetical protein